MGIFYSVGSLVYEPSFMNAILKHLSLPLSPLSHILTHPHGDAVTTKLALFPPLARWWLRYTYQQQFISPTPSNSLPLSLPLPPSHSFSFSFSLPLSQLIQRERTYTNKSLAIHLKILQLLKS